MADLTTMTPTSSITTYSFDNIESLSKKYSIKLEDDTIIEFFNNIRLNNKFNPVFTKKFNYTNWKNAISKEEEGKKNEEDILMEKIRSLLNKLTSNTLDNLKVKLIEYLSQNEQLLEKLISSLFNVATIQSIYCNVYAKLCVFLNNHYGENKVKKGIFDRCKTYFKSQYGKKIASSENDYDKFCQDMKEKTKLIGIFHLVGELYKENLINSVVIWNYLRLLFENLDSDLKEDTREKYVECLKKLILTVGPKYKSESDTIQYHNVIKKLKEYSISETLSFREKFMLMDVLEAQNSW